MDIGFGYGWGMYQPDIGYLLVIGFYETTLGWYGWDQYWC